MCLQQLNINKVLVGYITAAHGIKGAVKVRFDLSDLSNLYRYDHFFDNEDHIYKVQSFSIAKDHIIMYFCDINDRNKAELLRGKNLYISRNMLIDDLKEDEYYHCDLVNLAVRDSADTRIGLVSAMFDFGAGPLLEVNLNDLGKHLIPFTKWAVTDVNIVQGYVRIDLAACGIALARTNKE